MHSPLLMKRAPVAVSTPVMNKRMRVSLLQQENYSSPLRRRSRISDLHAASEVTDENDDEVERRARRQQVDFQRRMSTVSPRDSITESPKSVEVSEKDLKSHFEICIKLFAENKINSKNAWNLKIIDYMSKATNTFKNPLQIGSTSLDVSTKVYSIRVDDIHSDGLKLANTMTRTETTENQENKDDTLKDAEAAEDEKGKKKRKARRPMATIAKDPSSLVAPIPKLQSICFQTKQNFEFSLIENLCTNNISMDNSCCKFMLRSMEKFWPQANFEDEVISYSGKKPFQVSRLNNEKLCAEFATFEISEWNQLEEEDLFKPQESQVSLSEADKNDEIPPLPELDGSVHDEFEVALENVDDNEAPTATNEFTKIQDLAEYTYEQASILHCSRIVQNMWAGPSHWKLKCIKPALMRFSGQVKKAANRPNKKTRFESEYMDFDSPTLILLDFKDTFKIKHKPKTIDRFKKTMPLKELDLEKFANSLYQNEVRANTFIKRIRRRKTLTGNNGNEDKIEPYPYENPADQDYCSQNTNVNNDDSDHHNNEDDECMLTQEETVNQNYFLADNLIKAPELVPKTYVPYALQAKKMDMKKLKANIWSILAKDDVVTATTFKDVYKELPSRLGQKLKDELSAPLAFIALLHLANERNLQLVGQESLKNFKIFGPC